MKALQEANGFKSSNRGVDCAELQKIPTDSMPFHCDPTAQTSLKVLVCLANASAGPLVLIVSQFKKKHLKTLFKKHN